jgi:hypothetical protein
LEGANGLQKNDEKPDRAGIDEGIPVIVEIFLVDGWENASNKANGDDKGDKVFEIEG